MIAVRMRDHQQVDVVDPLAQQVRQHDALADGLGRGLPVDRRTVFEPAVTRVSQGAKGSLKVTRWFSRRFRLTGCQGSSCRPSDSATRRVVSGKEPKTATFHPARRPSEASIR